MFGAGAVTFLLKPSDGTINDVNKRLMDFYRVVKRHPEDLIEENQKHRYTKEYFYEARERYNSAVRGEHLGKVEEASLLQYLNRTCYNGLYRVNSKGEFNVPFGGYKNPDFVQADRIRKASRILKHLRICDGDFSYIVKEASKGDVVYFDPPYVPVSPTSAFTSYSTDGFGMKDQTRLADAMAELDSKGVLVILSNSDAPELKKLYAGLSSFEVARISARRAISCNGGGRGKVAEIVISNIPHDLTRMRF